MADALDMVKVLETALAENAGVVSITINGESVRYDRKQALAELEYWQRKAAREANTRPVSSQINLGGSW